ncbi:MAG: hypothetical protein E6R13_07875 [Spirochaetes bacterium]|nr:MAG: hypothetical protein E6R13_07875 [Spirochaetota bacterium]
MMEFFNQNPNTFLLINTLISNKGSLRSSVTEEARDLLVISKYDFKEEFKSLIGEYIESRVAEIGKTNLTSVYRLYINNEPGPVFLEEERAYNFIGLKKGSTSNYFEFQIKSIKIPKNDLDKLLAETVNSLSTYKKLVDDIREVRINQKRKRKSDLEKEIMDFSDYTKSLSDKDDKCQEE